MYGLLKFAFRVFLWVSLLSVPIGGRSLYSHLYAQLSRSHEWLALCEVAGHSAERAWNTARHAWKRHTLI